MSDVLKPCPFCGGKATHEEYIIEQLIKCSNCNVIISNINSDLLKLKWNRRHNPKLEKGLAFIRQVANMATEDSVYPLEVYDARELLKELEGEQ